MCKTPKLIKHPNAEYHLRGAESVFINNTQCYVTDVRSFFNGLDTYILEHFDTEKLSKDEIYLTLCNNSYVVRKGHKFPLFLRLCCGKCSECRFVYKKEIENRALIEASESSHVFFYTLTYDDEHLPYDGLHKSDVISAFKLLRQHIKRYLDFDVTFTQFYVGEYGTDPCHSLRPHYHGLIFVKELLTPLQIKEFFDLFSIYEPYYDFHQRHVDYKLCDFYSDHKRLKHWWPHGKRIDIQSARNVSALVRYVCKYITKNFSTNFTEILIHRERYEQHSNPLFVQLPKKRGLGCGNVESYTDSIMKSTNGCISINVHGTVERIRVPRIFITKLFPCLSYICPNATYFYKLLSGVLDILMHRSSYLSDPQLRSIIEFQRIRIKPLDYLFLKTLRRSQINHYEISMSFYNVMSDYELIEVTQLLFDFLSDCFDIDTFDNYCFNVSSFNDHLHKDCPVFNSCNISKKLVISSTDDISYIDRMMRYSFYDSIC